jgi:hypothetical protein
MSKSRNLAALLDSSGDVVTDALDNAGGGGGGAWTEISSTTVSSAVSEVEFTLSGYSVYKVIFWDLNWGSDENGITVQFTVGSTGTYSETIVFMNHRNGGMNGSSNHSGYGTSSTKWTTWGGFKPSSTNGTGSGELTIYNAVGMPNLRMESAHLDDSGSVGIGTSSGWARLESPSSTDTIGKVKFSGDQSDNFASGTFTLYGLN